MLVDGTGSFAIARAAGFQMLVMSRIRQLGAKKSGQNIPKNRYGTTIAEPMVETRAELPFIGDQVACLSHDQAARSGPASLSWGNLDDSPSWSIVNLPARRLGE